MSSANDDLLFYPEADDFQNSDAEKLPALKYYYAFGNVRLTIHRGRFNLYYILISVPDFGYLTTMRGWFVYDKLDDFFEARQVYSKLLNNVFAVYHNLIAEVQNGVLVTTDSSNVF